MRYAALVPVKSLDRCKSRLSPTLTPAQRADLQLAMLRSVLAALAGAERVAAIAIITRDRRVDALARECGAMVLAEPERGGLNAAVRAGCRQLAAAGHEALFVLPADLPFLDAAVCEAFLAAADAAGGAAIAPDIHGTGTNAMAFPARAIPRFCYGPGSYLLHRVGLPGAACVERIELSLDVDTPDDLTRAALTPPRPATEPALP
ncbi:2-phospho-L-lactate guanylyltransferase [Acuticoccus kandeliae]|uniref:2-phospho-L-lactate guanylyltransferase n=1 Tax=Acuticoccus kandeliae TaxID=2073160 RepID=UPI000D3E5067|nr:2-phospho-L-lactate guanylyltransferase [Acuticoccus kandeliae]